MFNLLLIALGVAVVALAVFNHLARQERGWLGFLIALILIAGMEAIFQWSIHAGVRSCLDSACAQAGLPAGCELLGSGCTEWTELSLLVSWGAGAAALVVFLLGLLGLAIVRSRAERTFP